MQRSLVVFVHGSERTPSIGLNKVTMPGNLVALDVPARENGYEILGEWPRRGHGRTAALLSQSRHALQGASL